MKRIIFYLLITLTFVSACESELIQTPNTVKVGNKFYSNETEVEEAVIAVYATLQFFGNYNIGMPAMGELPGEDAYDETPANDGGVYGQLDQYNVIAQNNLIQSIWQDSYKGIQRANIVLNRISDVDFSDNSVKNSRIGEMKFIRAILYFNLVRVFGDVPLVTEEITNPQNNFGQKRTPKSEIYDQINLDLNEAIDLLPNRTENNKMRVVKTAAQALLGKVKLTMGEYQKAKNFLLDVVNSGDHQLLSNVGEIFSIDNELNREIIFAVQFASGLNSNSEGSDAYRMFNPTGRLEGNMTGTKGHGVLKSEFSELYESNDSRRNQYIGILPSEVGYSNKIAVPSTEVGDSDSDWVVLRYADVILMLAEIDNELGNTNKALEYINMIRNRAGIEEFQGSSSKTKLFKEIDLQRRLELVWEGHRWFDLLRQGRAKSVLDISDDYKLLMPLPSSQIATDDALKQNPGY